MPAFTWTPSPIGFKAGVNSAPLDTSLNLIAGFVLQTPTNVDMSQLGIFQAGFYGITASTNAAQNSAAFTAAVAAAQANNGGTLFIPYIAPVVQIAGTIVVCAGSGTYNNLNIYSATNNQTIQQTVNDDIIFINNGNGNDGNEGGQYFHDFFLAFALGLTSGSGVHIQNGQNTFLHRLFIKEAPVGIIFDNTLHCEALECDIDWDHSNNVANAVGFMVGDPTSNGQRANQIRIARCQVEFNHSGTGTATCYLIQSVIHCTIDDCYGYGAPVCVTIGTASVSGNSVEQVTITNFQCGGFSTYGFQIAPQGTVGNIQDIRIIGGRTQQSGAGGAAGTVGIFVGINGLQASAVTDLKIIGHSIENSGLYGLQYDGGTNLQVIGGTMGSNGVAGIGLTGGSSNYGGFITIDGVDLSAQFEGNTAQAHAFLVNAGADVTVPIHIRGCPMLGYAAYYDAIVVTGTVALLNVKDCPGYTDQTILAGNAVSVTSNVAFNVPSLNSLHPYYGAGRLTFVYSGTITGLIVQVANNAAMTGAVTIPNTTSSNFFYWDLEGYEYMVMSWTGGGTITVTAIGH